ncbi:MAG: hypothetical protein ACRD96_03790 [Bryobacteraceae bacterium]
MTGLGRDLRISLRILAKRPGFAALAVATMGLAIGANAVVFSIASAVLRRPMPALDPEFV